jgi:hypothetical protein
MIGYIAGAVVLLKRETLAAGDLPATPTPPAMANGKPTSP